MLILSLFPQQRKLLLTSTMQCSESSPVIIYTPNILICGKIDRFAPDFSEKSIPESIDDGPI